MMTNERSGTCAGISAYTTSRRTIFAGLIGFVGGLAGGLAAPARAAAQSGSGVSHSAESIHQEVVFAANRKRVYDALTDAKQFEKVVQLSAAKQSMEIGNASSQISREAGGSFELFGGHITGRHIELVPAERIVQAWRAASWAPGDFSIARFVLEQQGTSTKLIFDHTGFPAGQGEHLATGWNLNYWAPLAKYLAG
jgi:activator of HSP90 ATPase